VDIGLGIFWWLELDNKTDSFHVETSGSDIGGDEDSELAFFEPLDGSLSLVLRDTTVHHFTIELDSVSLAKSVSVSPGGSENNHFSITHVALD
jgi:hypothetical protein